MLKFHKDDDRLLFLPLGGSGEIGMNLNLYGTKGRWMMVDCGMSFAGPEAPGVDLLFPDPMYIEEHADKLDGLLLTHGHEDHIGAVGYLWEEFQCPVYATAFTAELVKDKLNELGILHAVPLEVVEPHQPIEIGPFTCRYIPLAHSIAEGHGVAIETHNRRIFHTGDWKLDNRPLIGPPSPSEHLTALGEQGVDAVIGDSTNVFNPSESGSESAVRESLMDIIGGIQGRVVVTTFASNVARLATIGEVAKRHGRHLVLVGRSMHRIYRAAKATGYLKDFPPLVAEEDAIHLPRERTLICCTGCQGEPRAALSRMSRSDHRYLEIQAGDTVIFSSKIIPGNEITLGALFNALTLMNVDVITEKDAFIHVSGHPGRAELKVMYDWLKPTSLIPVHGEPRHLKKHASLAGDFGIANTVIPKNGDVIEIGKDFVRKIDEVPAGRLYLDGDLIVDHDDAGLVGRRRLLQNGVVSIAVLLSPDLSLVKAPQVTMMGLPGEQSENLEEVFEEAVQRFFDTLRSKRSVADAMLEEGIRIAIRRKARKLTGRNPSVISHIVRE